MSGLEFYKKLAAAGMRVTTGQFITRTTQTCENAGFACVDFSNCANGDLLPVLVETSFHVLLSVKRALRSGFKRNAVKQRIPSVDRLRRQLLAYARVTDASLDKTIEGEVIFVDPDTSGILGQLLLTGTPTDIPSWRRAVAADVICSSSWPLVTPPPPPRSSKSPPPPSTPLEPYPRPKLPQERHFDTGKSYTFDDYLWDTRLEDLTSSDVARTHALRKLIDVDLEDIIIADKDFQDDIDPQVAAQRQLEMTAAALRELLERLLDKVAKHLDEVADRMSLVDVLQNQVSEKAST
jgi:hypothetical protein